MDASITSKRWKRRPEGSNWGEFGEDDEIGRLNLITPAKVREAAKEVKEGLSFCLSLPLNVPGGSGSRMGPKLFATGSAEHPSMNLPMGTAYPGAVDVLCDDAVTMALQCSTQWDSLCHMGYFFDADDDGEAEMLYYNGWRAGAHIHSHDEGGAERLGIEKMAATCVQTRGVLIDFHRHFGPGRRAVSHDDMMRVLEADRIEITPGDIICLHTGFSDWLMQMGGNYDQSVLRTLGAELDGQDQKLLQWISDSGVAAIAADTVAVETFRRIKAGEQRVLMPLHEHCLFKLGLPLAEYWWLSPLAQALSERQRTNFMLTAPPLRLPGAVGSPVTPVGTI
jgi:kynurenine formamidase